jgi:CheY-like chemotaxis protein
LDVDTAPNGNIALRKFKGGGFDAVILDLMLPGIKGKELIKEIRKTKHGADIPVFAVTSAERMELWRKRGTKAGATKVLDKAAPVERIAAEIAAYLNPKPKEAKPAKPKEAEALVDGVRPTGAEESISKVQGASVRPTSSREAGSSTRQPDSPNQPSAPKDQAQEGQAAQSPIRNVFNTALLRKVAQAGKAARGTPPPSSAQAGYEDAEQRVGSESPHLTLPESQAPLDVSGNRPALSGDTPLNFGEPAEEASSLPAEISTPAAVAITIEARNEPVALEMPLNAAQLPLMGATPNQSSPPAMEGSPRTSDEVRELQEQLAELRRNRDELAVLLQKQTQIAAEPDPAMRKILAEAKAAAQCAEEAYQAEFLRAREYQEELARIREARDELDRKLAQSGSVVAENRQRSEEMEKHLAQCLAELERAKAELQKSTAERSALEVELRQQISGARQSAETAKVAFEEQASRAQRLAQELDALRQAREDLNARLSAEMQAAAESKRRMAEYELQLREREAEVERLKTELQRHAADKDLSKKLSAAQVAANDAQAVYKEEAARGAQSKKKLTRLNQEREELNARLTREEQAAAEARRRSEEMEQQLAARNAELERLKAELDRRAQERKVLEERLQQQVTQATEAAKEARQEVKGESGIVTRSPE